MLKVAHRGNTLGPSKNENKPSYVLKASEKYYVEIDVWYLDNTYFLGHDYPQYEVPEDFLENFKFFCHAKNIEALHQMSKNPKIHCFWHQGDLCTLTSKGYVWKYPEIYFEGKLWGICGDRL